MSAVSLPGIAALVPGTFPSPGAAAPRAASRARVAPGATEERGARAAAAGADTRAAALRHRLCGVEGRRGRDATDSSPLPASPRAPRGGRDALLQVRLLRLPPVLKLDSIPSHVPSLSSEDERHLHYLLTYLYIYDKREIFGKMFRLTLNAASHVIRLFNVHLLDI